MLLEKYKTKREGKNTINSYKYFLESNFLGVKSLFLLVYSDADGDVKKYRTKIYYLPKVIIKSCNIISKEKEAPMTKKLVMV